MRRISAVAIAAASLAVGAFVGCGDYEMGQPKGRSAAPEAVGVVIDPGAMAAPVSSPAPETPPAETPAQPQPAAPQPAQQSPDAAMPYEPPAAPEDTIREKAEVGMGRKGNYSQGIITTPLSTFWRTQEMVAYRVQVPQALNLYKATNGHFPKTQEEFVKEILTPNGIKLPELPQGHFYVYDAEKGELQVARPR